MHFTQGARWHTMTIGINWQRGLLATWRTQMLGSASLAYHDHRGINWHLSWIASNVKNSNAWGTSMCIKFVSAPRRWGWQGESIRRRNMANGTRYHVLASDLIAAWTSDLIAEWNAAIESQSAIQSLFYDFQRSNRCRLFFGDYFSLRSHRSQRSNRCF